MKTMTVAKLKSNFSSVLNDLRNGEEITIEYGKAHKKLGVIIPYEKYKPKKRNVGLLKNTSFKIKSDFKISAEDLLNL